MEESVKKRLDELRKRGFLLDYEDISDFRSDLHHTKLWADSFWRRRFNHKLRTDPELTLLHYINCDSVLEIGSAYGRFMFKAKEILGDIKYSGIEVCPYFESYFEIYKTDNINQSKIIYDNFFKPSKLTKDKFDLIILPMNTFPSFPFELLDKLLDQVDKFLNPGGYFLFSTYKLPEIIDKEYMKVKLKRGPSGEFLLDANVSNKITVEVEQFQLKQTKFGASSLQLLLYHRLNPDYSIIERSIFWSQSQFINKNYLDTLLTDKGFTIKKKDSKSHSMVYLVSIN